MTTSTNIQAKWRALLPLATFLIVYLVTALVSGDFYKMPVSVAFLIASAHALMTNRKTPLSKRVDHFAKGMGQGDIMLMCLIFILAGSFASVAKSMGAIDATVNMGLSHLPNSILLGGVFLVACFISISVGTSVGTVAALTPMAVGIASKIGIDPTMALGCVIGGSMFGDNMSMISDTTIAASRTQGCEMKDKFRANFWIVLPPAIIAFVIYIILGSNGQMNNGDYSYEFIKVLPYLFVLIAALAGMNVALVLTGGIVFAGIVGLATGSFGVWEWIGAIKDGIAGMSELVIICMLIGGTLELIKRNGGIQFVIETVEKRIHSKRGAEFGIGFLTAFIDVCTANNTIAIIIVGPIVKRISEKFDIKPERAASLMDTFSCFAQGIIPYGAQILTAVKLSELAISPFGVMQYLFYPYLLGFSAIIFIIASNKNEV